ncbi:MAG: hypothetical protein ACRD0B_11660 [Acidimicrobiales bacterium]
MRRSYRLGCLVAALGSLSSRRRRCASATAVLALLTLALVASGCGVPTSKLPRVFSLSGLPQALSEPLPTPPAPHFPNTQVVQVPVFLVTLDDHLVAVTDYVHRPATAQSILDALASGPTATQSADGYQTALLAGSHLTIRGIPNGVAVVNLDNLFLDLTGEGPELECGQIVLSLTKNFRQIHAVRFYFDNLPTPTEIGQGEVVYRAVTPADYTGLRS